MNKNVIFIVILILSVGGFLSYQQAQRDEAERVRREEEERKRLELAAKQAREGKIDVVKANVYLPANTRVLETSVRVESMSKELVSPNAQLRPEDVVNKYTQEAIPKDDIINRLRLTESARSLESFLMEGERFYSMRIDGLSAVTGYVKQGDRVDIVATMVDKGTPICRTVLSNLEVFSVGQYKWEVLVEDKKRGDLSTLTITFKLSGEQASRMIQLLQIGAGIKFMLRPPSDLDLTVTPGWTLDQIINDEKPGLRAAAPVNVIREGDNTPQQIIQVIRGRDVAEERFALTTGEVERVTADLAPLPSGGEVRVPPGPGPGATQPGSGKPEGPRPAAAQPPGATPPSANPGSSLLPPAARTPAPHSH